MILRAVLAKSPHKDVQSLAAPAPGAVPLPRVQPARTPQGEAGDGTRYEGLFGKDYVDSLLRRDRADIMKEVETAFESAVKKYADVKLPCGGTVGERAKADCTRFAISPSARRPRTSRARTRTARSSS